MTAVDRAPSLALALGILRRLPLRSWPGLVLVVDDDTAKLMPRGEAIEHFTSADLDVVARAIRSQPTPRGTVVTVAIGEEVTVAAVPLAKLTDAAPKPRKAPNT